MEFVLVLVKASASSGADSSSVTGLIGFIKVALDIVLTQDWMAMLLFTTTLLVNLDLLNTFYYWHWIWWKIVSFCWKQSVDAKSINKP